MNLKMTGTCVAALLLLTACEQEGEQEPTGVLETEEPGIAAEEQRGIAEEEQGIAAEDVEPVRGQEKQGQEKQGQEKQGQGAMAGQKPGGTTELSKITDNPQAYLGQQVTVEGDVEKVYGTRGLKLGDMVVLAAQNTTWSAAEEWQRETVQVTGTVRRAAVTDLKSELGRDFDTELQDAIEEQEVALVADNVKPVQQQQ